MEIKPNEKPEETSVSNAGKKTVSIIRRWQTPQKDHMDCSLLNKMTVETWSNGFLVCFVFCF